MANVSKAAFLRWMNPTIVALKELGGEAKPAQVREVIIKNEKLTHRFLVQKRGKTQVNKFTNEVAFARAYLVKAGYIDNKKRGIWKLTEEGKNVTITEELATKIFLEERPNREKNR